MYFDATKVQFTIIEVIENVSLHYASFIHRFVYSLIDFFFLILQKY